MEVVGNSRDQGSSERWFGAPHRRPECQVRVFCFAHAGGSARNVFGRWWTTVHESIEIWPVELPARWQRLHEPPFRRMEPLVEAVASAMQPHLDVPYALFGYSMGSLIAFELAHLGLANGRAPVHLFVAARRAPFEGVGRESSISRLPDEELLTTVHQRYGGMPPVVRQDRELQAAILPALRSDFEVIESYRARARSPLPCPISVFGGDADRTATREELEAWRQHTAAGFVFRVLSGDHFFVTSRGPEIAQAITADLRLGAAV